MFGREVAKERASLCRAILPTFPGTLADLRYGVVFIRALRKILPGTGRWREATEGSGSIVPYTR